MHLIHIVARNDILILSAQKIALGRVQLAGDIHRLSRGIIQTDGCKHFAADVVSYPVPLCL